MLNEEKRYKVNSSDKAYRKLASKKTDIKGKYTYSYFKLVNAD